MTKHEPHKKNGLTSIANDMGNGGDHTRDYLTMGEIITAVESRGFSAIITVLALIIVLPTGAIPGVPAVIALLIIFIAIQSALGLKKLPLPARAAKFSIERKKMNALIDKSRPTLQFIDRFIQPRLVFLCNRMMEWFIAVVCIGF